MKVQQMLNELALPDTDGFWINPKLNKTVECDVPHVPCVVQNSQIFKIDLKQFGYHGEVNWNGGDDFRDWSIEQDMQYSPLKIALYQRGWVRGWAFDFENTMGISGFQQPVIAARQFIIRLFSKKIRTGTLYIDLEDVKKHRTFTLPEQNQELYSFFG